MSMAAKYASQYPMLVAGWRISTEWVQLRCFTGIFFAICHFLEESLGLLFIREGKSGQALLDFEAVEENTILVVRPVLINFLVP